MSEVSIRIVGSKLVVEIDIAKAVAQAFIKMPIPAMVTKPSVPAGAVKPGPKPGRKPGFKPAPTPAVQVTGDE